MMPYFYVFIAGLLIAVLAVSLRNLRSSKKPKKVLDDLERFIADMEAENDRFMEMISNLRKKMDEENLTIQNRISGLGSEIRQMADRVQSLERRVESLDYSGVIKESEKVNRRQPPSYLSPKYQEVARLLIDGQDTQAIAKELGIGRGEVDFVARLMESERDGQ